MKQSMVTYGRLDKVLRSLGFSVPTSYGRTANAHISASRNWGDDHVARLPRRR
jgi:hypothetical protein